MISVQPPVANMRSQCLCTLLVIAVLSSAQAEKDHNKTDVIIGDLVKKLDGSTINVPAIIDYANQTIKAKKTGPAPAPAPSSPRPSTVLAAGGTLPGNVTAELYSSLSATWAQTGAMISPARVRFRMVLLADSTVLAAGGDSAAGDFETLDSAELYAPSTGLWTAAAAMNVARSSLEMVTLQNGSVLAVGGTQGGGFAFTVAELYSPSANLWTFTGEMAVSRGDFQMLLLPTGRVLAAGGGTDSSGNVEASAELFAPETGTWSNTGSMGTARAGFQMLLLPTGKVLAIGGYGTFGAPATNTAEIFDPATGTWTATGSMATARSAFQAVVLADGSVLVAGGVAADGVTLLKSAELFDAATGKWSSTGDLITAKQDFQMVVLSDGKVLAAGSGGESLFTLDTAENDTQLFDPQTGTWSSTTNMLAPRASFQMLLIN